MAQTPGRRLCVRPWCCCFERILEPDRSLKNDGSSLVTLMDSGKDQKQAWEKCRMQVRPQSLRRTKMTRPNTMGSACMQWHACSLSPLRGLASGGRFEGGGGGGSPLLVDGDAGPMELRKQLPLAEMPWLHSPKSMMELAGNAAISLSRHCV